MSVDFKEVREKVVRYFEERPDEWSQFIEEMEISESSDSVSSLLYDRYSVDPEFKASINSSIKAIIRACVKAMRDVEDELNA